MTQLERPAVNQASRKILAMVAAGVLIASCSRKSETESISWPEAEKLIREGRIQSVVQAHSREIWLTGSRGAAYRAVEPKIDDVIHLVREVDPSGKKILVATE